MMLETTIRETTERETDRQAMVQENTGIVGFLTQGLDDYLKHLSTIQNAAQVIRVFSHCSDATGGYVQMRPEYQFIPVLLGSENEAVPLYEFVEVLDGVLDYDSVIEELPQLTYPQISGAISFLRKIAQFNPKNIDIDRLEDEQLSSDSQFIEELTRALADKETSRVLASDK